MYLEKSWRCWGQLKILRTFEGIKEKGMKYWWLLKSVRKTLEVTKEGSWRYCEKNGRYWLEHLKMLRTVAGIKEDIRRRWGRQLAISWGESKIFKTLVHFQLDAQNSYLFTCNKFIKILYMFRALPCSSPGGLRRNYIYAASGIVTVCRWLSCTPVKKELSFLTGAQDSHLQRVTIPEAAHIQLRRGPPDDEQG